MKYQITLERKVKATIEETYEVDCEENELDSIKELILEEAEQECLKQLIKETKKLN